MLAINIANKEIENRKAYMIPLASLLLKLQLP